MSTNNLTPYDTGDRLEPQLWPLGEDPDSYGRVDFDNDESATVLQAKATPSDTTPDTTVLRVTGFGPGFVEIIVAGKVVWFGDAETGEAAIR